MGLAGQADRRGERGYAMAALLVMMAIMAVLMTVAMPVWRHEAQREKEEETIFRGMQYARAIAAYQRRVGTFPTNLDVLVEGRYLRKKFKDPLTKDGEWQLIPAGATSPGGGVPGAPSAPPQAGTPMGGIGGVTSKNQETSIRTFRGATRYNLWQFTWQIAPNAPRGGGPGGRGGPGGPGGPGMGPGGMGPGGMGPGGTQGPGGRGPTSNPPGFPNSPSGSGGQGRPPSGVGQPNTNQPPFGGRGPGRGGRGI